jgi:hypothetical protein
MSSSDDEADEVEDSELELLRTPRGGAAEDSA